MHAIGNCQRRTPHEPIHSAKMDTGPDSRQHEADACKNPATKFEITKLVGGNNNFWIRFHENSVCAIIIVIYSVGEYTIYEYRRQLWRQEGTVVSTNSIFSTRATHSKKWKIRLAPAALLRELGVLKINFYNSNRMSRHEVVPVRLAQFVLLVGIIRDGKVFRSSKIS